MALTQLDTSTLTNQNISSALLCHTYTNTTRKRVIYISVFADQVTGNGDYVAYVTVQRAGTGSAYRGQPKTTATVASGVTSIAFFSGPIPIGATDVVKVYLTGLGSDTTTPDIITVIDEDYTDTDSSGRVLLQPTQTGVTIPTVTTLTNAPSDSSGVTTLLSRLSSARAGYLDNLSAGAAALEASVQTLLGRIIGTLLTGNHNPQTGDTYARLGAPAGASIAADIAAIPAAVWAVGTRTLTSFGTLVTDIWANGTRTLSSISALASQIASAVLDAVASSYNTAGTIGAKITTAAGAAGGGSSTYTATVTDANGVTLDGVQCWATTDAAGANLVASGVTNSHGKVTFALDPGGYYLWRQRAGVNFTNPAGFTVT